MDYATFEKLALDPIGCSRELAEDVLFHERTFFQNAFYRELEFPDEPNFHFGFGGSLLAASVSLLLPEALRIRMRNVLFRERGNTPAPKSRKVMDLENPMLLGWCQLVETSKGGGMPCR